MSRKPEVNRSLPPGPGPGASLTQWLTYLESIHPAEIDLGLDRVLTVLRKLFPRKPPCRVITIAGTNGKGSTVACLEALMLGAGRTTGAYTSPHLSRYNERIRINGRDVDDDAIVAAFEQIERARATLTLTYFEFGTLAAFLIMHAQGVQDWILEVGLGGRLDAVNVWDADLAIITSVDIDHTDWLGNDRDRIGFEKAGIFRHGKPAIYADAEPPRSVLQQAHAQKVSLVRFGVDYTVTNTPEGLQLKLAEPARTLSVAAGPLPDTSIAAAVQAACLLQPALTDEGIRKSLTTVKVPGRFERVHQTPTIYLDVGHNPHAARWLALRLGSIKPPGARILAVYGCLSDKDSAGVVGALIEVVDQWLLAGLTVPRGLSMEALHHRLKPVLPPSEQPLRLPTVRAAIDTALAQARADDIVIIFGSFFTVAEARAHLGVAETSA